MHENRTNSQGRTLSELPPRWLDELDPEAREYAEMFEVEIDPATGLYVIDDPRDL